MPAAVVITPDRINAVIDVHRAVDPVGGFGNLLIKNHTGLAEKMPLAVLVAVVRLIEMTRIQHVKRLFSADPDHGTAKFAFRFRKQIMNKAVSPGETGKIRHPRLIVITHGCGSFRIPFRTFEKNLLRRLAVPSVPADTPCVTEFRRSAERFQDPHPVAPPELPPLFRRTFHMIRIFRRFRGVRRIFQQFPAGCNHTVIFGFQTALCQTAETGKLLRPDENARMFRRNPGKQLRRFRLRITGGIRGNLKFAHAAPFRPPSVSGGKADPPEPRSRFHDPGWTMYIPAESGNCMRIFKIDGTGILQLIGYRVLLLLPDKRSRSRPADLSRSRTESPFVIILRRLQEF